MSYNSSGSSSSGGTSGSSNSGYVLTMIDNQTDQMLLLKEGRGMWRQEMRYRIEPWSTVVITLDKGDASRQGAALIMYNVDEDMDLGEAGEATSPVYVPIDQLLCHKRIVVCWKKGRYLWTGHSRRRRIHSEANTYLLRNPIKIFGRISYIFKRL